MLCRSHPSSLDHSNYIWWQVLKVLVMLRHAKITQNHRKLRIQRMLPCGLNSPSFGLLLGCYFLVPWSRGVPFSPASRVVAVTSWVGVDEINPRTLVIRLETSRSLAGRNRPRPANRDKIIFLTHIHIVTHNPTYFSSILPCPVYHENFPLLVATLCTENFISPTDLWQLLNYPST
jgi:hypothetical protein